MNSRWTGGVMDGELDFDEAPFISLFQPGGYFFPEAGESFGSGSSFPFVPSPCRAAFPAVRVGSATFPFDAAGSRAGASRTPFAGPWPHDVVRNRAHRF